MPLDTRTIAVSFGFNCAFGAIILTVYLVLHLNRRYRKFFEPIAFDDSRPPDQRPPPVPRLRLLWPLWLWRLKEEDIVAYAGTDVAVYLRIFKLGERLFLYLSLWCIAVVLPTNMAGGEVDRLIGGQRNDNTDDSYEFSDFDKTTLANVPSRSKLLFVHLVSTYVVTFIVTAVLWSYCKRAVVLRVAYVIRSPRGGASHSVLIQDIPGTVKGTRLQQARQFLATATLVRFLPRSARKNLEAWVDRKFGAAYGFVTDAQRTVASTVNNTTDLLLSGAVLRRRDSRGRKMQLLGSSGGLGADADIGDKSSSTDPSHARVVGISPQGSAFTQHAAYSDAVNNAATLAGKTSSGVIKHRSSIGELGSGDGSDMHSEGGGGHGNDGVPRNAASYSSLKKVDAWTRAHEDLAAGKSFPEMVEKQVCEVYPPGGVQQVHVVRDESKIVPHVKKYFKIRDQLTTLLDLYASKLKAGQHVKRKKVIASEGALLAPWSPREDALLHYADELQVLLKRIETEREARENDCLPAAFVTYQSRWLQTVAAQSLWNNDAAVWTTRPAPAPAEVLWHNLGLRQWDRKARRQTLFATFVALLLTYTVPIAALQALLQLQRLDDTPVLAPIVAIPIVRSLLSGVLPGLVLRIFLLLLPTILAAMLRRAGAVCDSDVDEQVMTLYFIFQVATVFITSFVAGTLLNQVQQFIDKPATILTVLGSGAPQTASFFLLYILFNALVMQPLFLLRIWKLIIFSIRYSFAATARAKRKLWADPQFVFGSWVPNHTIIILLGLTFAVIAPVLLPVALLYFCVAGTLERYQQLYVYGARTYESGGKMWRQVFFQVMTGVYIFQLVTLGLLSIKKFLYTPLLVPLIIYTVIFNLNVVHMFDRPWNVLSLRDATDLDLMDAQKEVNTASSSSEGSANAADAILTPPYSPTPGHAEDAGLIASSYQVGLAHAGSTAHGLQPDKGEVQPHTGSTWGSGNGRSLSATPLGGIGGYRPPPQHLQQQLQPLPPSVYASGELPSCIGSARPAGAGTADGSSGRSSGRAFSGAGAQMGGNGGSVHNSGHSSGAHGGAAGLQGPDLSASASAGGGRAAPAIAAIPSAAASSAEQGFTGREGVGEAGARGTDPARITSHPTCLYVSPAWSVDPGQHEALLAEVQDMERRLEAAERDPSLGATAWAAEHPEEDDESRASTVGSETGGRDGSHTALNTAQQPFIRQRVNSGGV